jgi:hypothetical protein
MGDLKSTIVHIWIVLTKPEIHLWGRSTKFHED